MITRDFWSWLSVAEMGFLLKLLCSLLVFWGLYYGIGYRWVMAKRVVFLKVGIASIIGLGGLHVLSVGMGGSGFGRFDAVWSDDKPVLRFSSLEAPDQVPPSIGFFPRWDEGDQWIEASENRWWEGNLLILCSLGGGIWYLGRLWVDRQALRRALVRTTFVSPEVNRTVDRISRLLGLASAPEVRVSGGTSSPYCCGFFRSVIVLGKQHVRVRENEMLESVLCHEISHIRSGDLRWLEVIVVLQSLLWYVPLLWGLRSCYSTNCERLCDARTVQLTGDAKEYAWLLAETALLNSPQAQVARGLGMVRKAAVRRRIEALSELRADSALVSRRFIAGTFAFWLSLLLWASTGSGPWIFGLSDGFAREENIDLFGMSGSPASDSSFGELQRALKSDNWKIRKYAAMSLALREQSGGEALPVLREALEDSEWQVRQAAAYAILAHGPDLSVKTELEHALNDREWHVRKPAVLALGRLGHRAVGSVDRISMLLADEEWHVRVAAVVAVGEIGQLEGESLRRLRRCLFDEEPAVRTVALRVWRALGLSMV